MWHMFLGYFFKENIYIIVIELLQIILRAYAEALEIIPYTLAENAGMNPINVVTELRNKHANN